MNLVRVIVNLIFRAGSKDVDSVETERAITQQWKIRTGFDMDSVMRKTYRHRLNKAFSSKFPERNADRQTHEEAQGTL